MGALECVVFGSAEVALVRCQKANLGEVWRGLFEGDSLLLRDAGDHDQHLWWRAVWKSTSVSCTTSTTTLSSRLRVDGVEDDATIQHERAVKF